MTRYKLKTGDTWYPVEMRWWNQFAEYTLVESKEMRPDMSLAGPKPAEIENADLAESEGSVKLRQGMQENLDYKMVHEAVWKQLVEWYGGGPAYPRIVIERGGAMKQEVVELYPQYFKVFPAKEEDGEADEENAYGAIVSVQGKIGDIIKQAKEKEDGNYRIWLKGSDEEKQMVWQCLPLGQTGKTIESFEFF
jgi:hypothetical protein